MYKLVSTRFDSLTLKENTSFKNKHQIIGCIYGQPRLMHKSIKINEDVFVIEMNNTLNIIEGIGLIKNITYRDKNYKIYTSESHNQHIYKSKYRIDREHLIQYNEKLVIILDNMLFKGRGHLKRGYGFTSITEKIMNKIEYKNFDLIYEIKILFERFYVNNENNYIKTIL